MVSETKVKERRRAYSISDDEVLAFDFALRRPAGRRARLNELCGLPLNVSELLDTFDGDHGLLETDETPDHEQELCKVTVSPRRRCSTANHSRR